MHKDNQLIYEAWMQGLDTHWKDGDVNISLNDVLQLSSDPVEVDPKQFSSLLINVSRDEKRVDSADLSYPIVVATLGDKPTKILDGQHRVVKAIKLKQPISARYLDLDKAPQEYREMFT